MSDHPANLSDMAASMRQVIAEMSAMQEDMRAVTHLPQRADVALTALLAEMRAVCALEAQP